MKTIFMTILALLVMSASFAGSMDVKPKRLKKGSLYIRVTSMSKNRVKIEQCLYGREISSCEHLGNKAVYTIEELNNLRGEEENQVVYAVIADIGLIAAGAFTGGVAVEPFIAPSLAGGAIAGSATGIIIAAVSDVLNPFEQNKQAATLKAEVIHDDDVTLDDAEDISKFIARLNLVLSKL